MVKAKTGLIMAAGVGPGPPSAQTAILSFRPVRQRLSRNVISAKVASLVQLLTDRRAGLLQLGAMMQPLHRLLGAQRDQHADDDGADLLQELAPAMRFGLRGCPWLAPRRRYAHWRAASRTRRGGATATSRHYPGEVSAGTGLASSSPARKRCTLSIAWATIRGTASLLDPAVWVVSTALGTSAQRSAGVGSC